MRYLLSLSLLVLTLIANARQITCDEAQAAAQDFFNNSAVEHTRAPRAIRARALNANQTEENAPYYVFNASGDHGFVIISGDDRAKKILGYSDTGNFDFSNMPPQLSNLLSQYEDQINTISNTSSVTLKTEIKENTQKKILETAPYHQGYPFNLNTPTVGGTHYPTGCVATAMAIIMKYHNWPDQSIGNKFFNYTSFQEEYHDFNTTYNWNNILFDYSNNINNDCNIEVAKLVNQIATSVGTSYVNINGELQAGAFVKTVHMMFNNIFRYSGAANLRMWKNEITNFQTGEITTQEEYYTAEEWYNMIINEIDNNRPVLYSAYGKEVLGHCFVIDGYDTNDLFHINWGWGSSCNGFFALTSLLTDENINHTYEYGHEMCIGIQPEDVRPGQISKLYFENTEEAGIYFDQENITSNNTACFALKGLRYRIEGDYELGIALKNDGNEIVEVHSIKESPMVTFKSEIRETWKLQAIYRENNGDWIEIPSPNGCDHCPVIQKNPIFNITLADGLRAYLRIENGYNYTLEEYKNGSYISFSSLDKHWLYVANTKDNRIKICLNETEVESYSTSYPEEYIMVWLSGLPNKIYNIEISKIPYSSLEEKVISLSNASDELRTIIPENQRKKIGKLTIKGELSYNNCRFIAETLPNLYSLDLSGAIQSSISIFTDIYDKNRLRNSLTEFKIPNNITDLSWNYVRLPRLNTLYIPKGINKMTTQFIDQCPLLKAIYMECVVPPSIEGEGWVMMNDQHITIYVPFGSKSYYEANPNWNKLNATFVEYDPASINPIFISDCNSNISIYNLQGINVFHGQPSEMPTLPNGVYLRKSGNKVVKFIIR